jgi:glycosyltransferase involved in cell wall biosynthesis
MKTVNLSCPITPHTGYGITSFNILKSLLSLGHDIHLFPIGNPQVQSQEDKNIVVELINAANNNYSKNNPCLKIWHQFDLASRIGSAKYGSLVFFEVDTMNNIEINSMNNTDCVFVASKWAQQVLESNHIHTKIVVSPLAVDTSVFKPILDTNKTDSTYRFINIGKWEIRKGHDFLIEAFDAAFTEKDDVELWMMNHNPFLNEDQNRTWYNLYSSSKLKDKIKFIPRVDQHKDVAKIISQTDCGIFPARAEGWNNEILEVMAMNKPVITTNYSAHTEYCTNENSFLINIDKLCVAKDDHFFKHSIGKWANLGYNQMEQTIEHMRYVYTNNIRTNQSGLEIAQKYTWDNTANIIAKELFT